MKADIEQLRRTYLARFDEHHRTLHALESHYNGQILT